MEMVRRDIPRSEMAKILGKSKSQIAARVYKIKAAHQPLGRNAFKTKWRDFCDRRDIPFVEYGR